MRFNLYIALLTASLALTHCSPPQIPNDASDGAVDAVQPSDMVAPRDVPNGMGLDGAIVQDDGPLLDVPNDEPSGMNNSDGFDGFVSDVVFHVGLCAPVTPIVTSPAISAPRLIAPLSGSVVSTTYPTFRWQRPAGVTGGRVEICFSRDCAPVAIAFDADSDHLRPNCDLPNQTLYFRVRSKSGGMYSMATSETWQLRIPRTIPNPATVVDSVLRYEANYNGDPFADVAYDSSDVVGGAKTLTLRFGTSRFIMGRPDQTTPQPAGAGSPRFVGDVNGDGLGDFATSGAAPSGVRVYFGNRNVAAILGNSQVISAPMGAAADFGANIVAAGDVDGDGYGDFLISAGLGPRQTGQVYLQRGGVPFVPPSLVFTGTPSALGGFGVSAGDMHGDGLAEIAIAQPFINGPMFSAAGVIDIYRWSAALGRTTMGERLGTMPEQPNQRLGLVLSLRGDTNGDGRADLITNADGYTNMGSTAGAVGWRAGTAAVGDPAIQILRAGTLAQPIAMHLSHIGDINSDGLGDIAVTQGALGSSSTQVLIYQGVNGAQPTAVAPFIAGDVAMMTTVGAAVAGIGDFDGDSTDDFVCTVASANAAMGSLRLYSGGRMFPLVSSTLATGIIHGFAGSN